MERKGFFIKATIVLASLLIVLLAGACQKNGKTKKPGTDGSLSGSLTIIGSETVQPLAQAAAEEFMEKYPDVSIAVEGGGSSVGIEAVSADTADIGNSSRELKDLEENLGLTDHEIAIDAVVVIVHPTNKISDLTKEQTIDIFTGRTKNWKKLGGPDQPIQLVSRDEASGTRECFFEKALDKTDFAKNMIIQPGNTEVVTTVAKTENAIAYTSLGYVDNSIKTVKFEGVEGTEETAKDETFSISRKLHMFTKGEPNKLAKAFIDFVLTDEFQNGTLKEKFIPLI